MKINVACKSLKIQFFGPWEQPNQILGQKFTIEKVSFTQLINSVFERNLENFGFNSGLETSDLFTLLSVRVSTQCM